jgi:hypothetical protein
MSIATLKKKTMTQYNNMSVGSKNGGFSINGTRRSQGYIGRGVLGLHFPRTPMRGNEARGNGGCCGTYKRTTIVQSGVPYPTGVNGKTANNDPSVVKSSVLDTNGLIMTKYRWIRRPQPYAVVKPDSNMIQNTQNLYIENLSKNTIADLNACNEGSICKPTATTCGGLTKDQRPRPFDTVIRIPRGWYSITKTPQNCPALGPMSQSTFIQALGGLYSKNDPLPKSATHNGPLPGPAASW